MRMTDLFNTLNIPYVTSGHHHCRNGWIQIDCPFCGKDTKKYHMGYSLRGHFFNCWRCGPHNVVTTVVEITGISEREVRKLLKGVETDKILRFAPDPLKSGTLKLPENILDLKKPHKRYLRQRGFTDLKEIQSLWGVSSLAIAARLSWRLFIPILYKGKTVSWTTRAINDSQTRWISASEKEESLPHKDLLYGEDYARHAIIICEGIFDVWKIGKGAVAVFGVSASKAQMNKMIQYPVRAVCYDNEPLAQKRANKLVDELSIFPGDTFNIQLDSNDAGCATEKEIKKLQKLLK